ncbi:unnamed protein product [Aureobasidium uvarum]|uniref:Uncharacterized protein n=1 Tax=Aureobasidium uvarum TaxID=2773716 RepID=A0A9N8KMW9_9PEZI|nr:unnamed protein product [Aureobasidium uvarum]
MCFWRHVYYIDCKHYSRDPVECTEAYRTNMRCEGWEADDKEMESQTASGTSYTKAEPGECMDCKYMAMLRRNTNNKKSGSGSGGKASGSKTKA